MLWPRRMSTPPTVAITGAAGLIGSILSRDLHDEMRLRLFDLRRAAGCELLDLRDLAAVEAAFAGIDSVIHLGALSTEAPFEAILESNIRGTYNVFEAARRRGVRRVVFASSNHVTGMYPRSQRIGPDVPLRPDTYYGVSKAFGESLGRLYAEKWNVSTVCIRIGSMLERPADKRQLATWLSPRDGVALFRACLRAEVGYAIVYGVSANRRAWWDMTAAHALGYRPVDDAEAYAAEVPDDPSEHLGLQGGVYSISDFAGEDQSRR